MGLPHLDFRVPEGTWFKSALAERIGSLPALTSAGALAWPYKVAVVAVMALVACGTLVTFGTAGAETPASSTEASALPGGSEPNPSVEGQVVPSNPGILNSSDLLSTLNLTDYSPDDVTKVSLADDSDSDDDSDAASAIKKKLATPKPTPTAKATNGTHSPTPTPTRTSSPTPAPTTASPTPTPTKTPTPTPTKDPRCSNAVWRLGHLDEC